MVTPNPTFSAGREDTDDRATPDRGAFDAFVARVRACIDSWLLSWLDARVSEAGRRGPDVAAVADAVRQLILRGGKRMRAVLLAAAYEACGGKDGLHLVAPAGAALELLQAYLLAHDDWMDGDDLRRGGPSVPAMMRARYGDRGGSDGHPSKHPTARSQPPCDATSVLAGDLAAAWALRSMLDLTLAPARVALALRELGRVEEDVVQGQVVDVCGVSADPGEVEAGYALKTGSYTVRGPVVMGARLAGASDAQIDALTAFAEPLGVAFQLRDDVLGTFGDAKLTGKPSGNDLRKGKRTALVVDALRYPQAQELLSRVMGRADATDSDTAMAISAIEASGARARVEQRITSLAGRALCELGRADLTPAGSSLLRQAVVALTERDR